jgi:uncharacterized cupin superfamily protein
LPAHARDYNHAQRQTEAAMTTPSIVDFRRNMKGEESAPAPDRVLKGEPKTSVRNYFSDPSGQFCAGTWSSTVGKWKIDYTENEFCHLLEGRVVITSAADGKRWQFNAGDAWVIPAGFSGTWETVEPARKRYAIFEAAKPAG